MTANKSGIALAICTVIAGAALVACGGSGSSSSTTAATADNVYLSRVGTYSSGCVKTGTTTTPLSELYTLVVSNPTGSNQATASFRTAKYTSNNCAEGTASTDMTATGQVTALAGTKTITEDAFIGSSTPSGTAQTANFSLTSLTGPTRDGITVPAYGTSTTVGYMFQNGTFYALAGPRDTDGLSAHFYRIGMTKQ